MRRVSLRLLPVLAILAAGALPVRAQVTDTAAAYALSSAFRSASERALPAVVYVQVEKSATAGGPNEFQRFFGIDPEQLPPAGGSGSGFIIESSGLTVTNNHVIEGADRITVRLQDGREFDAELVGTDADSDVALIRIAAHGEMLPVVPGFVDSDAVRVGDWVLALGNPLGYDFTVTAGIVSAKGRQLSTDQAALESYIQTDAAINPGNSGGPLVDLTGRIVGMNTAIGGANRFVGYSFAVPSNLVQRVVADLREYGWVRRPQLGIRVQPVTAVDAELYGLPRVGGAKVFNVTKGSPADRAGLRAGDVILTLDGRDVASANALTTELAERHPGDRVELGVSREGRMTTLTATLGEFERTGEPVARPSADREEDAGRLGFRVQPLTPQMASRLGLQDGGLVIVAVQQFSPAAGSGLVRNLIVRSVNGTPVPTMADFDRVAASIRPGDIVSIRAEASDLGEVVFNYRLR